MPFQLKKLLNSQQNQHMLQSFRLFEADANTAAREDVKSIRDMRFASNRFGQKRGERKRSSEKVCIGSTLLSLIT